MQEIIEKMARFRYKDVEFSEENRIYRDEVRHYDDIGTINKIKLQGFCGFNLIVPSPVKYKDKFGFRINSNDKFCLIEYSKLCTIAYDSIYLTVMETLNKECRAGESNQFFSCEVIHPLYFEKRCCFMIGKQQTFNSRIGKDRFINESLLLYKGMLLDAEIQVTNIYNELVNAHLEILMDNQNKFEQLFGEKSFEIEYKIKELENRFLYHKH